MRYRNTNYRPRVVETFPELTPEEREQEEARLRQEETARHNAEVVAEYRFMVGNDADSRLIDNYYSTHKTILRAAGIRNAPKLTFAETQVIAGWIELQADDSGSRRAADAKTRQAYYSQHHETISHWTRSFGCQWPLED